jgi:hypothetical protein
VVAACGRVEDQEGPRIVRQLSRLKHAYVKDQLLLTTSTVTSQ